MSNNATLNNKKSKLLLFDFLNKEKFISSATDKNNSLTHHKILISNFFCKCFYLSAY